MFSTARPINPPPAPYPHSVCVISRHSGYPERAPLTHNTVPWSAALPRYSPAEIEIHTASDLASAALDPDDARQVTRLITSFDGVVRLEADTGRPINPHGRTGLRGRGVLFRWGANLAADPLVTRVSPHSRLLEMITIRRSTGEIAIPGGFVDADDASISATLKRELREETSALIDLRRAKIVFTGYCDDPRNTDNAWIETTAAHLHLPDEQANRIQLKAGDDALPESAKWTPIDATLLKQLYASHARFVRLMLEEIYRSVVYGSISSEAQEQIRALIFQAPD